MSDCSFRTDLADELIEKINKEDYSVENHKYKDIYISHIKVLKENNALNKKIGDYVSISFNDMEDQENRNDIKEVLVDNLKKMIEGYKLKASDKVLVVGLGNQDFSADALGPLASKKVIVTNHLLDIEGFEWKEGTRSVALITPGVMGQTGLESADIVKSVCDFLRPGLIIFIDALATKSLDRVNRVIQLTNTGISPGSGIGNNRKSLDEEFLNAPCICIGVATVVGISSIVNQTLDLLESLYGELPLVKSPLKNENRSKIVTSLLEKNNMDMIVTPKQIDEDINNLAYIVGNSINEALHLNRLNL